MNEREKKFAWRADAITDGVFAIVATLLVLDIKLPNIPPNHTQDELFSSLAEIVPSLMAFAFSFLTIIVYWLTHDYISEWLTHYTYRTKMLNANLLFWICLIPFPTKFISEYPTEPVAVATYGATLFLVAVSANFLYWNIAFRENILRPEITVHMRKNYRKAVLFGPISYGIATALSFVNVFIAIGIYILIPLLFIMMPRWQFSKEKNL